MNSKLRPPTNFRERVSSSETRNKKGAKDVSSLKGIAEDQKEMERETATTVIDLDAYNQDPAAEIGAKVRESQPDASPKRKMDPYFSDIETDTVPKEEDEKGGDLNGAEMEKEIEEVPIPHSEPRDQRDQNTHFQSRGTQYGEEEARSIKRSQASFISQNISQIGEPGDSPRHSEGNEDGSIEEAQSKRDTPVKSIQDSKGSIKISNADCAYEDEKDEVSIESEKKPHDLQQKDSSKKKEVSQQKKEVSQESALNEGSVVGAGKDKTSQASGAQCEVADEGSKEEVHGEDALEEMEGAEKKEEEDDKKKETE